MKMSRKTVEVLKRCQEGDVLNRFKRMGTFIKSHTCTLTYQVPQPCNQSSAYQAAEMHFLHTGKQKHPDLDRCIVRCGHKDSNIFSFNIKSAAPCVFSGHTLFNFAPPHPHPLSCVLWHAQVKNKDDVRPRFTNQLD